MSRAGGDARTGRTAATLAEAQARRRMIAVHLSRIAALLLQDARVTLAVLRPGPNQPPLLVGDDDATTLAEALRQHAAARPEQVR